MTQPSQTHAQLAALARDGHMSASDVLAFRRTVFPDGVVDRDEIELLFALGKSAPDGDPAWPELFAETCADYFLNEEEPEGYITDEEFTYLKGLVTRDGFTASALELNALIALKSRARQTPEAMSVFVAEQIKALIAAKATPSVDEQDTTLIRSFLYAAGGSGAVGISRSEADFLFDIHDLVLNGPNALAWDELFVKAIAAHLMQHVGYTPMPREEALRLTAWSKDSSRSTAGFMRSMLSGGLKAIVDAYTREDEWSTRNAAAEKGATTARRVSADEAAWLTARMGRNGQFDEAERALLLYMRDQLDANLPPLLKEMAEAAEQVQAA